MNKLLYLSDDEVQSQLATKYNLLVRIGQEIFQYAIIDPVHQQVKVLAEFEIPKHSTATDLIKAIENLPESRQLKFAYNSVKISFHSSNYTFIPSELYIDENRADYGKYLNLTRSSELLVNSLSSTEIKNVVGIEFEFYEALNKIFHRPEIFNQASPFLEGVQKSLRRDADTALFIDVQAGHFQAALFKDFRLEFSNTFEFANTDEFNYYLLSIIKSLAINIEQASVTLSGNISGTDEVYQRIEKYFENIEFTESEHILKYLEKYEEVKPHAFFTLFSLDLCV